jgi:hypothetical protein
MSHHFDTPTAKEDSRVNVCDFYVEIQIDVENGDHHHQRQSEAMPSVASEVVFLH